MVKVIETINANRAKIIAGFLAFLLTAAALVTFGLLGFVFWLNTEKGGNWMVSRTNAALSDTGYVLSIDKFKLSGLLSLKAQSFQLSFDDKKIITGKNISLDVNLASMAFKHPEINLKASSLTIHDFPQSAGDRQNKDDGSFEMQNLYFKTAQLNIEIETFGLSETIVNGGLKTRVDLEQNLVFNHDRISASGHVELGNTQSSYAAYLPKKIETAVLFYPANRSLYLEKCTVIQDNYSAILKGHYVLSNGTFNANVSAEFVNPKTQTNQMENPVIVEADIEGTADDLSSIATLTTVYQKHPLEIAAEIRLKDNILSLSNLRGNGASVDIIGEITYDLNTAIADGRLKAIFPDLKIINQFADDSDIAGSATADLIFSSTNGAQNIALNSVLSDIYHKDYEAKVIHIKVDTDDIKKLENFNAEIALTEARIASVEIESAETTITIKDGVYYAVLSGHTSNLKAFSLAAEGHLENFDPYNIQGDIRVQSNLQTFAELFLDEGYELEGGLAIDGNVSGTISMPEVKGTVHIENGLFADNYNNIRITNITADANFDNENIQLLALTAKDRDEKGALTLSGDVDFADRNNPQIEAALHLENMHLLNHKNFDGWLNADISLQTEAAGYLISGTLSSSGVSIRLPDSFGNSIPKLNIIESDARKPSTGNLFTRTKLDLTFKADNQIFINGFGLDAELQGLLNVRGALSKPLLQGDLRTIRGRYEEFGRRFALDRVILSFRGPMPPSPYLDIAVSTKVDDITGRILITNSIENPEITFDSTPALPEDEVLSIILFGKNIQNISPFQTIQLANTVRRFSGGSSTEFDPLNDLQTLTSLDDIYIKDVGAEGLTVGAGKYISDDVYIKVEQGTKTGSSEASVEVQLMPSISLQSKAAQNGESNIGLFWEWEY